MKSKPKTIESYAIISKKAVFLFSILFFVLLKYCAVPSFSQSTITVVGRGATKEQALQDALRTAVEKATGVFLYSVSDIQNLKVVQDKIVTQSKGYVKDYQIVEQKNFDGLIVLTVTITVDVESIKTILRKDLKAVTYDDVLKDYMLVTQKMERLRKSADLLQIISSRPADEMYSVYYIGYEIEDVGLNEIEGRFLVKIIPNSFYWGTYEKILQQVSEIPFSESVMAKQKDYYFDVEIRCSKKCRESDQGEYVCYDNIGECSYNGFQECFEQCFEKESGITWQKYNDEFDSEKYDLQAEKYEKKLATVCGMYNGYGHSEYNIHVDLIPYIIYPRKIKFALISPDNNKVFYGEFEGLYLDYLNVEVSGYSDGFSMPTHSEYAKRFCIGELSGDLGYYDGRFSCPRENPCSFIPREGLTQSFGFSLESPEPIKYLSQLRVEH